MKISMEHAVFAKKTLMAWAIPLGRFITKKMAKHTDAAMQKTFLIDILEEQLR